MAMAAAALPSAVAGAGDRLSEGAWLGRMAAAARAVQSNPDIAIRITLEGAAFIERKDTLDVQQCVESTEQPARAAAGMPMAAKSRPKKRQERPRCRPAWRPAPTGPQARKRGAGAMPSDASACSSRRRRSVASGTSDARGSRSPWHVHPHRAGRASTCPRSTLLPTQPSVLQQLWRVAEMPPWGRTRRLRRGMPTAQVRSLHLLPPVLMRRPTLTCLSAGRRNASWSGRTSRVCSYMSRSRMQCGRMRHRRRAS